MSAAKIVTQPATEPVSLADAKAHLALTHSADDALVTSLIKAARRHVENTTGARLITQTWAVALDSFPSGPIQLAGWPLQSVTSIAYTDENGDAQTMDSADYVVDTYRRPGWISPVDSWPSTLDTYNAVVVTFVVGYGDADDVPDDLIAAIKMIVAGLYANRESTIEKPIVENQAVYSLLWHYREMSL